MGVGYKKPHHVADNAKKIPGMSILRMFTHAAIILQIVATDTPSDFLMK